MTTLSFAPTVDDVRALRLQRFRRDQQELANGSEALVALDAEIATTARQIDLLTLKFQDLKSYRSKLVSQNDLVIQRVETQKLALFPFQYFPEDVLGVIFSYLGADQDAEWTQLGQGYFNKARAQSPFTVAAVCRLWRTAAKNTPPIWNYAGVPRLEDKPILAERTLARIRVVVSRSGATSLDVLFENVTNPEPSYFTILGILYPELYRWRRCEIYAASHIPGLLEYLRGPAPRLEELCIVQCAAAGAPPPWPEDHETYLSHNPPLQRLIVENTAILPGNSPTLQHLELKILENTPSDIFWGIFRNFSNLLSLDLTVCDVDAFQSPQTTEMLSLQVLSLRQDATRIPICYPQFLRLPSLFSLTVDKTWSGSPGDNLSDLGNFLSRLAQDAHVTSLCILSASLNPADGDFVASPGTFHSVISLTLEKCSIHAAFWDTLCDAQVLQNLRDLNLLQIMFEEGSFRRLIHYLRWRKANERSLATTVKNSNLSDRDEVELRYISEW